MFMLLNTLVWGAAFPIIKPALTHISPFQFLFFRYIWASLLSVPILIYYLPKVWRRHRRQIFKLIFMIICLELLGTTFALSILYEGLARTTSIEAGTIAVTTPLFTTLMGIWWLHEKEEKNEWMGLLVAISGTMMLTFEPVLSGRIVAAEFSLLGNLLVLSHNLLISFYYVLAKKYYATLPKLFVTSISFWVGVTSLLPLVMMKHNLGLAEVPAMTMNLLNIPSVALASIYMATFGSIIGLTAYIKGQDGMEASEAALFTYLQPLVFIPMGIFFLGESINSIMITAMGIIAIGVVIAERRG